MVNQTREPDAYDLDEKWHQLIADNNDTAICLQTKYERALREAEEALSELRDLARQHLS